MAIPRPGWAFELQHWEEALLELLQAYPSHVLCGPAEQPEAGWYFGQLWLLGIITRDQYDAAAYLDKVTHDYERMLHRHGTIRSASLGKVDGTTSEDLSQSAEKSFTRAKRRYDKVYDLLTQCGEDVREAIITSLRKDEKTDIELITRGLTVLSTGILPSKSRRLR